MRHERIGRMNSAIRMKCLCNAIWVMLMPGIHTLYAQNLVVNPSFEEHTGCPHQLGQMELVPGWSGIWGSPDYFNACADDSMGVPFNALGYQWPSDGDAYAGIGFFNVNGKEWLQGELSEPLVPGVLTYLSFRASPGGFGYPAWTSPYLVANNIGMRLSVDTVPVFTFPQQLAYNTAPLYLPTILSDTANWTYLSTSFMPDSAYRHLQIGNFFADSLCLYDTLETILDVYAAYAFIDKVCVSQQPGVCDPDQSIGEWLKPTPATVYVLHDQYILPLDAWGYSEATVEVKLFDQIGRQLRRAVLGPGSTVHPWPVQGLPSGYYVLALYVDGHPPLFVRSWKP